MTDLSRYSRPAILLHWLTAILVLAVVGLALFRETFSSASVAMIGAHKQVGLALLVIVLVRLAWRIAHCPPPLPRSVRPGERRIAAAVHRLLYALLIAVPVAGWLFVSLAPSSRPLHYRGPDTIPRLPTGIDDAASFSWHEAHELLGFALIGLFILHVAGVARHELVLHDRLLARMAPPGWARWLATLATVCLLLWGAGLAMDLFAVRLMG